MKIHHGTTRTVITIPQLGIAIKIAKIKLLWACREILAQIHDRDIVCFKLFIVPEIFPKKSATLWYILFCGSWSNMLEWWYTIRHGTIFTAPTYFSCGFFSIQRSISPLEEYSIERCESEDALQGIGGVLFRKCRHVVSKDRLSVDGHHWMNEKNFGLLHGKLVMCDYGSPKTQAILRKYAKQLDELDLASVV